MSYPKTLKIILIFSILINVALAHQLVIAHQGAAIRFRREVIEVLISEGLRTRGLIHAVLGHLRNGNNISAAYYLGRLEANLEVLRELYESLYHWYKDSRLFHISDKIGYVGMTIMLSIRIRLVEGRLSNDEVELLEKLANATLKAYDSTAYHIWLQDGEKAEYLERRRKEIPDYVPPTIEDALKELSEVIRKARLLRLG